MDNNKTSVFKSRKFKYGSLSVGLTVLLIVLIIVFNAAVYAVTYSFGWYLDLTGKQYYGITEEATMLLDPMLTSDVQIKVIFCREKDRLLEDEQGFMIYKCIESFQKEYPSNIKVEFLDINKHPEDAAFYQSQTGQNIFNYNIIMESNKTSSRRVLDFDNFFVYDSESQTAYAFNGEGRFVSYIISLCADIPKCYFITGQGEDTKDSQGNPNALWDMLSYIGFENAEIDLSKPENNLDDAKMIVINAPEFDYTLAELEKIDKFMYSGGNAMVFLSTDAMVKTGEKELTEFKRWLKTWGVETGGQIVDSTNSIANTGGLGLMTYYPEGAEGDFAPSLHSYMRGLDSCPDTIVNNAISLKSVWVGDTNAELAYDPILYSHSTAKVGGKEGTYDVASLIRRTTIDNDTEQTLQSYMFVSSAGYAEQTYLNSNAYGNKDILRLLADQMAKELVPVGLDYKPFTSEALAISNGAAYAWTIVLTAVFPIAIITTGVIICYRRKRS